MKNLKIFLTSSLLLLFSVSAFALVDGESTIVDGANTHKVTPVSAKAVKYQPITSGVNADYVISESGSDEFLEAMVHAKAGGQTTFQDGSYTIIVNAASGGQITVQPGSTQFTLSPSAVDLMIAAFRHAIANEIE